MCQNKHIVIWWSSVKLQVLINEGLWLYIRLFLKRICSYVGREWELSYKIDMRPLA